MATVPVRAPFRLDLTATALRRLSTNVVDTYTPQDGFVRAHRGALLVVRQTKRDSPLDVRTLGAAADFDPVALTVRMLGTDRELRPFYRAVKAIPWLDALATRMRGIKPPRYPTLWETIVNAVIFQQISIHAASAILRRLVEALNKPLEYQGRPIYPFFEPERYLRADPDLVRRLGISPAKAEALRASALALSDGSLQESEFDRLDTSGAMGRLMTLRGIGPWTAAVICLRGLGRLDVFPLEDSGAARSLKELSGEENVNVPQILEILGEQRGMLYYHLLLGRLERAASQPPPAPVRPAPPRPRPRGPRTKSRRRNR